uniref:Uncharacterized protein n=1 Tax=Cucumis melo TaxID=3656 RepID=A0A9I9EKQ6_CUCME
MKKVGANSDIHWVLFDGENRAVGFHAKSGGLWFFLYFRAKLKWIKRKILGDRRHLRLSGDFGAERGRDRISENLSLAILTVVDHCHDAISCHIDTIGISNGQITFSILNIAHGLLVALVARQILVFKLRIGHRYYKRFGQI